MRVQIPPSAPDDIEKESRWGFFLFKGRPFIRQKSLVEIIRW